MNKRSSFEQYLSRYAALVPWTLNLDSAENITRAVVIPAFAEKDRLFDTLLSLAQNPKSDLDQTAVICVINNKPDSDSTAKKDNLDTLHLLDAVCRRLTPVFKDETPAFQKTLRQLAESHLRIGYIDAASSGQEIPKKVGGVGMARKIGMDHALRLLGETHGESALIFSLDADTLVESNYLSAANVAFTGGAKTAIMSYAHQVPQDPREHMAICRYELFLRYWVLGLKWAGSPYAYHAIGSTIVTTARAYVDVRGMNRRDAGEDFYFLNKLAKAGQIGDIRETTVYPSGRTSTRVPFGTGASVSKYITSDANHPVIYDPQVFTVLKHWLETMTHACQNASEIGDIMKQAAIIHPTLAAFLTERGFESFWLKIRSNSRGGSVLRRHFHYGFDAFETLKLINYLSLKAYPRIDLPIALSHLIHWMGLGVDLSDHESASLTCDTLMETLHDLREVT